MAEVLGMVHMSGREVFRWRCWPVGPKLVFGKMAAPVPEIMDIIVALQFENSRTFNGNVHVIFIYFFFNMGLQGLLRCLYPCI
jgi:Na+/H+ antiporter NhaC